MVQWTRQHVTMPRLPEFIEKLTPGPPPPGWQRIRVTRGVVYARRDGLSVTITRGYESDGREVRTGGLSHPRRMPTEDEARFAAEHFLGVPRGHVCFALAGTLQRNYLGLIYDPDAQDAANDVDLF